MGKEEKDQFKPETVDCLDCNTTYPFDDEVCPNCNLFNSQKYKYLDSIKCIEDSKKNINQTNKISGNKKGSKEELEGELKSSFGLSKDDVISFISFLSSILAIMPVLYILDYGYHWIYLYGFLFFSFLAFISFPKFLNLKITVISRNFISGHKIFSTILLVLSLTTAMPPETKINYSEENKKEINQENRSSIWSIFDEPKVSKKYINDVKEENKRQRRFYGQLSSPKILYRCKNEDFEHAYGANFGTFNLLLQEAMEDCGEGNLVIIKSEE